MIEVCLRELEHALSQSTGRRWAGVYCLGLLNDWQQLLQSRQTSECLMKRGGKTELSLSSRVLKNS